MRLHDVLMLAVPCLPVLLGLFGIGEGKKGGIGAAIGGSALGQALGGGVGSVIGGIAGGLGIDGLGGSGFQMPKMTAEQKAAQAALLEQGKLLGGFGTEQLDLFKQGKLREGQEAAVTEAAGAATASAEQFLAGAGLSDSSFAAGQRGQIARQTAMMREQLLQGNFQEALSALGMSSADYGAVVSGGQFQQNLQAQIALARQQAASSGMGALFGAIGTVGGAIYGGPAGAMAGGAAGSAIGSTLGSGNQMFQ